MSRPVQKLIRTADSPSLWNCSLSPGWTRGDLEILRLAIMKFGIGAWSKIIKQSCLPGKTPSQLNLQTQRMMGQQSLAEFMGLRVDAQVVWAHNNLKQGSEYKPKNGCLINTGNNPTKEETRRKLDENRKRFGIDPQKVESIVVPSRAPAKELTMQEKRNRLRRLKENLVYMQQRLEFLQGFQLFPFADEDDDVDSTLNGALSDSNDDEAPFEELPTVEQNENGANPIEENNVKRKRAAPVENYYDDDELNFLDDCDDDDFENERSKKSKRKGKAKGRGKKKKSNPDD